MRRSECVEQKGRTKKLRTKLYLLLALDDDWYLKPDTELFNQICEIGEQLNDEKYIWRKKTIEKDEYLSFIRQGLTYVEIARRFKISVRTLFLWRKENGFM